MLQIYSLMQRILTQTCQGGLNSNVDMVARELEEKKKCRPRHQQHATDGPPCHERGLVITKGPCNGDVDTRVSKFYCLDKISAN